MLDQGFMRSTVDTCVYVRGDGAKLILLLYVDDMLIVGKDKAQINRLKSDLSKSFAMKDLGATKQILGMRITVPSCKRTWRCPPQRPSTLPSQR